MAFIADQPLAPEHQFKKKLITNVDRITVTMIFFAAYNGGEFLKCCQELFDMGGITEDQKKRFHTHYRTASDFYHDNSHRRIYEIMRWLHDIRRGVL